MSRILVIDDEASLRTMVRRVLEPAGHTVVEASDGREGMALWRRGRMDVVVTDLYMPEKDGVEVILEIRKLDPKQKILVMSGGGQMGVLDWCTTALSLGADGALVKPFSPEGLLSVVQVVLANQSDALKEGMPSSGLTDKRKSTRLPVYLPVSFGDGQMVRTGTVVDISREGCRIHCPDAAPELQYFQVEIHLVEPREKLKVELAVRRWLRNGELGVEFIQMEPDHQARLRSVIRTCEEACAC